MASLLKEIAERMEEDAYHLGYSLTVLIENYKDQIFWETLIEHLEPKLKTKIDFPYYSEKGTRGKSEIYKFKEFVKSNFIICVDSDCEHLYNDNHWIKDRYIYHTYVHSVESFQSNSSGLSVIIRELTTINYDFNSFFDKLSKKLNTIFYLWLYVNECSYQIGKDILCNENIEDLFTLESNIFKEIGDENDILDKIEIKVNNLLESIKNQMTDSWFESVLTTEIPLLKDKLKQQFDIDEGDSIYFIYGHAVFEKFVYHFVEMLSNHLKVTKIKQIEEELHSASQKDIENSINHFKNIYENQSIKTKLNDNYKFPIFNPDSFKWIKYINDKMTNELFR